MKIERSVGEKRQLDRFGNCESARIGYVVSQVDKDAVDEAVATVFALAPDNLEGIPKNSAEILRSPGGGIIEIGVNYKSDRRNYSGRSAGDRVWKIDVVSRNQPIRRSLGCVYSQSLISGVKAPDPGTRLEWNGRPGSRAGNSPVYIMEPEMVLSCVATFRSRKLASRLYCRQVASLVGKVNMLTFHGWNAGELLFSGMNTGNVFSGKNGEDLCNVTFRFNVRCNGERKVAGIVLPEVDGWDYVWTLPSANPHHAGAASVHVSRIYERASFAPLDI